MDAFSIFKITKDMAYDERLKPKTRDTAIAKLPEAAERYLSICDYVGARYAVIDVKLPLSIRMKAGMRAVEKAPSYRILAYICNSRDFLPEVREQAGIKLDKIFSAKIAEHSERADSEWLERISSDTYLPKKVRKAASDALVELREKERDTKVMKEDYTGALCTFRIQMEEQQACPSLGRCPLPKKCPGIRKNLRIQVP